MINFFLFTVLFSQVDLIIILDEKPNSKLLKEELTRDWTNTKYSTNLELIRYNQIREKLSEKARIHLISSGNYDTLDEWRVPKYNLPVLPAYKIGRYSQDIVPYDDMAFLTSGYPLRYTQYIVDDYFLDDAISKWKTECQHIADIAESRNYEKIVNFLWQYFSSEAIEYCEQIEIVNDGILPDKIRKHPEFPKLIKPLYPTAPRADKPWECNRHLTVQYCPY